MPRSDSNSGTKPILPSLSALLLLHSGGGRRRVICPPEFCQAEHGNAPRGLRRGIFAVFGHHDTSIFSTTIARCRPQQLNLSTSFECQMFRCEPAAFEFS